MSDELTKRLLKNLQESNAILSELMAEKGVDITGENVEKTPANFGTNTPLHGNGGIWSDARLERDIISAHVTNTGIAAALPLLPSVYLDPRYGTLTGFTAVSGSEPTYACEDAPSGYVKGCNLTARFGLIRRDTQTIEMDDVMTRVSRGDHTDLLLRGKILNMDLVPSGLDPAQILNVVTMSEMVNVGVQTDRVLGRQMWQGVTTVTNEFPGLDVQIATGVKDADTNTLCPALDSDVKDYAYHAIDSTIVDYVTMLEWYLNDVADRTGLSPVNWVIAMRPELWYELTAIWPCAYNTNRCSSGVGANASVTIDGRENVAQRDAMRAGRYIDINGRRYQVVLDQGIFEHTNVNNANVPRGWYASSIYFVPLTISGNFPVTYREYLDYRGAQADVNLLHGANRFFWTDNGVFSWAYEEVKWCYKLSLKTQQRVILRTPHLAGRIDHILYSPLQHLREGDPASPYFKDGGVSLRAGNISTPYQIWTSR